MTKISTAALPDYQRYELDDSKQLRPRMRRKAQEPIGRTH